MSKVLLFSLPCKLSYESFIADEVQYNPSLGLLAIASYTKMHGHDTTIVDFNYERFDFDTALSKVEEIQPDLVGITAYTENVKDVIRFARLIKKNHQNTYVVVGGPHATLAPKDLIKSRYIDFVSMKEGEATFVELLEYIESGGENISLDMIDGIMYKEGKELCKTKVRKHIGDLNLLPLINRSDMEMERYQDVVNIYTSRGCPANCIYCAATAIAGAKYRKRSIDNVFLEIILLRHQLRDKSVDIYMIDDTFTADTSRVYEFTDMIERYKLDIQWSCESRMDVMTKELLEKMVRSGCYSIQFGIESGNQQVLEKLRKKLDLSHAADIIKYAANYTVEICLSFMLGHYCDTIDTMGDTFRFMKEMYSYNPQIKFGVGINTPLPGTWQYTHAEKIGLKKLTTDYSRYDLITPVIEGEHFTVEQLLDFSDKVNQYVTWCAENTQRILQSV